MTPQKYALRKRNNQMPTLLFNQRTDMTTVLHAESNVIVVAAHCKLWSYYSPPLDRRRPSLANPNFLNQEY